MNKTISILTLVTVIAQPCLAEWPTYRADNRRSGSTDQKLTPPLTKAWSHSGGTPQQAWTGPAKWDSYSTNSGLQSMRNFDPCYYTTISGGKVFYGSSADNAVHCINLSTGKNEWKFFTNSAVRMPPSIANGKAYIGSDDGYAYALNTADGKLLWKTSAAPSSKLIYNNGKTISTHPVRTGVTLVNDQAIFAGSLLPWNESFLISVDATTGKKTFSQAAKGIERGASGYNQNATGVTLQGAMLTDGNVIYIPQGRAPALKFDLKSGKSLGVMGAAGGVFCILTEDNQLIAGPASQRNNKDQISLNDSSGKNIAAFNNTNRVGISKDRAFMHINGVLKSLDHKQYATLTTQKLAIASQVSEVRKALASLTEAIKKEAANAEKVAKLTKSKADVQAKYNLLIADSDSTNLMLDNCWKWETKTKAPSELIVAGDHLICGFAGSVEIFNTTDGKSVWKAEIDGVAHGISVSDGHLVISTDRGEIITFK